MLFAVDVGNTNITVGLFDGKKLIKTFRITTGTARTSDEYGVYFVDWLRVRDIHISEIDAVIIASVVPKVMHSLTSGIIKYLNSDRFLLWDLRETFLRSDVSAAEFQYT